MKNLLVIGWLLFPVVLSAQYFGRNKVSYEEFPFSVLASPHFEINHYLSKDSLIKEWAHHSECWYTIHQNILRDTFSHKNPIIFYNNHAHFQQTRAISGNIGVGTGGVTEALKNRVIMPFGMTQQQSNHVLGHEMVHAFQYHMILSDDSTNLNSLQNLPLWMIEGMAEYLSIGKIDPNTAMWMRDAYLHNQIPPLKKLFNYAEYFPYRYGQAFWAYLTGTYGDTIMEPFFMATAKMGFALAVDSILHTTEEELSNDWQSTLKDYYVAQLDGRKEAPVGKKLISRENSGRINVSPSLSPDGRFLVFYSEKDLFTIDLFLADARTGEVLNKVASVLKDQQIDDFQYIESAGSWAPDNRRFVIVAFQKGKNILLIKEALTGKTLEQIVVDGVPALSNPVWSPDGNRIVFTGLVDGQTDLYEIQLSTREVTRLTNDPYSEMHPSWSPDGSKLVFATDQLSRQRGRTNGKWTFNLATMDLESRLQEQIDLFFGADNLNPQFDAEETIIFLSDRDGFRNIYQYIPWTREIFQLTDLLTGVSGITAYAPAIHIGNKKEELVYLHYFNKGYDIYKARVEEIPGKPLASGKTNLSAAALPPFDPHQKYVIQENLNRLEYLPRLPDTAYHAEPYRSKFRLDYVGGGGGIGIGTNSSLGNTAYLSGGVDLLFTDMLGYHQLYTGIFMNGEIYDFGGIAAYINQKNRLPWGISISHLPYRGVVDYVPFIDTIGQYEVLRYTYDIVRLYEDQIGAFAYWPFSQNLRAEFGASVAHYHYRIDRYDNYYDGAGFLIDVERERIKEGVPDPFNLINLHTALVGDNSYFGLASPMQGHRFRVGADQYFGKWQYLNFVLDARKYYWFAPFSLGFRLIHAARIGPDAQQLTPMYVGDPYFVRGYGYNFDNLFRHGLDYDQLLGSKLAVANVELRLPLTGPKRIAAIPSNFLFSELALFFDGGGAWDRLEDFNRSTQDELIAPHEWISSTGLSWRVNFFGAMVIETYYALPIQEKWRGVFGVNLLSSGW